MTRAVMLAVEPHVTGPLPQRIALSGAVTVPSSAQPEDGGDPEVPAGGLIDSAPVVLFCTSSAVAEVEISMLVRPNKRAKNVGCGALI